MAKGKKSAGRENKARYLSTYKENKESKEGITERKRGKGRRREKKRELIMGKEQMV